MPNKAQSKRVIKIKAAQTTSGAARGAATAVARPAERATPQRQSTPAPAEQPQPTNPLKRTGPAKQAPGAPGAGGSAAQKPASRDAPKLATDVAVPKPRSDSASAGNKAELTAESSSSESSPNSGSGVSALSFGSDDEFPPLTVPAAKPVTGTGTQLSPGAGPSNGPHPAPEPEHGDGGGEDTDNESVDFTDLPALFKEQRKLLKEQAKRLKELEVATINIREEGSGGAAERPPRVRVSPHDVKLRVFSGHHDANARVIAMDHFLPLLEWLRESLFTLRASNLEEVHQVPLLISHLVGPAKSAFMHVHNNSPIKTWTVKDAELAIASLVPDHKQHFSREGMNMTFRAESLPDDIAQFELLMKHGEIDANTKYVFDTFQSKLLDAKPEILGIAGTQYGLRLSYTGSFEEQIAAAQAIVLKLGVDGHLAAWTKSHTKAYKATESGSDLQKRKPASIGSGPMGKRAKGAGKADGGREADKKLKEKKNFELAKKYSRCFKCGYHVAAAEREAHRTKCSKNREDFSRRMGLVAAKDRRGEDPNVFDKTQK